MIVLVALFLVPVSTLPLANLGVSSASPNCDTFTDCYSCASATSWTGSNCRWCPLSTDMKCHAEGSLENKCDSTQQVTDPSRCKAIGTTEPTQIHIALGGENAMTVSWHTNKPTATSTVRWGPSAVGLKANLTNTASGDAISYLPPSTHHHVTIDGLEPSTRYTYVCGDNDGGFSDTFFFTTAPKAGTPFTVSIFGDWGYGENGNAVETFNYLNTNKDKVDFTWHLGDLSYADDAFLHDATGFEYENVYDGWMNWIQNISAFKPYMVAVGNHESECHSPFCLADSKLKYALSNFSAYNARWRMPNKASGGVGKNMWYSFNYGLAHFVVANSETDFKGAGEENTGDSHLIPAGHFAPDGEFLRWLEADLAQANALTERAQRPWIFVGAHRPIYDSTDVDSVMQSTFEDLFIKYKVDIFFNGHKHSYASSWPTKNKVPTQKNFINPQAPVHLLIGGAGCDEMKGKQLRLDGSAYGTASNGSLVSGVQDWVKKADNDNYGTATLEVFNSSVVRWRYILSKDGSVADEIVIHRQ